MKLIFKWHYLWHLLRIGLGLVFVGASYYKIMDPASFAHQIYNYKILPVEAINPIAIVLPWLQFFCGLSLILNRLVKGASFCVVIMLAVFQAALISALARGLNISCGCFKTGGAPANWWNVARDAVLLILAGVQLWKAFHPRQDKGLWMSHG